jgi:hypothetical protein
MFSYFLPFSKKQTAPTYAFTALSQAVTFLGPFLELLGDLSGAPLGPPWARGALTTVTPVEP